MTTVGMILLKARKKRNLSLRDAVKLLPVSRTTLMRYERDENIPSPEFIKPLIELYGLDEVDFVMRTRQLPKEVTDWIFDNKENLKRVLDMARGS